jgi:hypothetical protein
MLFKVGQLTPFAVSLRCVDGSDWPVQINVQKLTSSSCATRHVLDGLDSRTGI